MTPSEHQRTAELWGNELRARRMRYPDEDVVRFLAWASAGRADTLGDTRSFGEGLDVGFGSGRHLAALSDFGYRANGIEIIDQPLDALRAELADCTLGELKIAALDTMPFPAESMDVATLWGMIFYRTLEHMRADLATTRAMLRSGGKCLVNFRARDNWFAELGEPVDAHTMVLDERAGPYANMTYTFVDLDEATALCTDAGLTVEQVKRVERFDPYPERHHAWWILWCSRP